MDFIEDGEAGGEQAVWWGSGWQVELDSYIQEEQKIIQAVEENMTLENEFNEWPESCFHCGRQNNQIRNDWKPGVFRKTLMNLIEDRCGCSDR